MLLIDALQDVDHELEDDHDVLLYLFPLPLLQGREVVEGEDDQADDIEDDDGWEKDNDVELDDVE